MNKTPNQIREAVRKELLAKHKQEMERKDALSQKIWEAKEKAEEDNLRLKHENEELKEKLNVLEDWNRRLMEFMDMPEDQRKVAYKAYIADKQFDELFKKFTSPYIEDVFSLIR